MKVWYAYYMTDLQGTFIDGNVAAEQMIGYKRAELIGKSFLELELLRPEQMPRAPARLFKNAQGQPTGPDEFVLVVRHSSICGYNLLSLIRASAVVNRQSMPFCP